jgi:pilus assembly protein CpaB
VLILVVLGLVASVCAAVLIAALTNKGGNAEAVTTSEPTVEVLLASRDLAAMAVIDSTAVTTKKVLKSEAPANALLNPVLVVGKVITDHMVAGQMFTKNCFAREGSGVYLASAVPPGKRAMSISLNDWSGMAGLLYPGSVVDVLVSFKTLGVEGRRDETEMMATTLLQGLQVLAIGSQSIADEQYKDKDPGALAQRGQMNFRMVTLLVDTKQAEVLQLAMQNGSISLSMRNPLDTGHEARRLTRAREISPSRGASGIQTVANSDPFKQEGEQPQQEAPAGQAPPAKVWETVIIRGAVPEKRTFPLPAADNAPAESHAEPIGAGAETGG